MLPVLDVYNTASPDDAEPLNANVPIDTNGTDAAGLKLIVCVICAVPAWLTVNDSPPTEIFAERTTVPEFPATAKVIAADPVPDVVPINVSHPAFDCADHAHPACVFIVKLDEL